MAKRILSLMRRIRGRSPDELRVRTQQALAALAERLGCSSQIRLPTDRALFRMLDLGRLPGGTGSAEALWQHFRTRSTPRFFPAFAHRAQTALQLRQLLGDQGEQRLRQRADRICAGRFDLLGLCDLEFGTPIDWHREPVAGKRAPQVHWSRIPFLDAACVGDNKVVWELNRHQHFLTLGRAYWCTGAERYAQVIAAHLDAWMDANPPKQGINWASSLEVAFRAVSWLWAFYFLKESPHLTPRLWLRCFKFLVLHARHLETYLSTYFSPNTHLTGEALGLYYLGTLLPEFHRAAQWRTIGRRILLHELHRHVQADGVYFEQSSYYHRYTTDFYAHLLILDRLNGAPATADLEGKYTALLDHLLYLTRPDGTTPFVGDDDGGRFVPLDERPANDFRAALSTGAALFARPDYKQVAGEFAEESFWLMGEAGRHTFERLATKPPVPDARAFTEGGYYVLRDGWDGSSNYLLFDCGPHGTLNCGHAHADVLAFELAAGGRTLLVDPGTYTYTASAADRDAFRSASAHNTLTIDGESSSAPAGPFTWKSVARAQLLHWRNQARCAYVAGRHEGYTRLADPATHERSILFLKRDYGIVRDRVSANGRHRYELHFHFAADAHPEIDRQAAVPAVREKSPQKAGLDLFTFGPGSWRHEQGWVSPCYGTRLPAPVLIYSADGEGPQEFVSFLLPRVVGAPEAQLRELAARQGRAFEIVRGEVRDVVLLGGGGAVEAATIVSDFEWTWARLQPSDEAEREVVLLNGTFLRLEGRELFRSAERTALAVLRLVGEELCIETETSDVVPAAAEPRGARRAVLA